MLPALFAELLHLLERLFAVLRGFARRTANRAAKVGDNEFCFGHKVLTKCNTKNFNV